VARSCRPDPPPAPELPAASPLNTNRNPQTLDAWLELLETRHPKAIDLGLERCREVWARMGAPQPAPSVYVVAGTNGKGSTVATICALLGALGRRHGSYTTPHLYRYNERVQVDGRPVSDRDLLEAFDVVESARGTASLTYFEFGTLAALRILSRADLDFAVMEIGLGGRLDAVNLLDAGCSVITAIGLDHQDYLGPDLLSIGREKAGIIRTRAPVICGEAEPPASVLEVAASLTAPVKRFGREFRATATADGVDFTAGEAHLALPRPALDGAHQVANMATGLAAVLELLPEAAAELPAVCRGLRSVRLAGRFERVSGQPAVWIDVGHNPMAAQAVARALADAEPGRRLRCVLGMLADKDAEGVASQLGPCVAAWYCASLGGSRGQSGEALAARIGGAAAPAPVQACPSVPAALDAALADTAADEGVLVFGSFATAAEAGRHLLNGRL
jgi:dihydrofolate synthase/folylpolyglutamate synthase